MIVHALCIPALLLTTPILLRDSEIMKVNLYMLNCCILHWMGLHDYSRVRLVWFCACVKYNVMYMHARILEKMATSTIDQDMTLMETDQTSEDKSGAHASMSTSSIKVCSRVDSTHHIIICL